MSELQSVICWLDEQHITLSLEGPNTEGPVVHYTPVSWRTGCWTGATVLPRTRGEEVKQGSVLTVWPT